MVRKKPLTQRTKGEAVKVFGVNPNAYVQTIDASPPPSVEGDKSISLGEYASRYKLDTGRKGILEMVYGTNAFKSPAEWKFAAACVAVKPDGVPVEEWVETCREEGIPCGVRDWATAFIGDDADDFIVAMRRGPLSDIEKRLMVPEKWDALIRTYLKNAKVADEIETAVEGTAAAGRIGLASRNPIPASESKEGAGSEGSGSESTEGVK